MGATGTTSSPPRGEVADQVTILLVDDDETWARATARLLESTTDAFAVTTAHSLSAGRRAFANRDPDCVVCDYQLGDGTGLALLDHVRETDLDRPFILITGRGDESVASEAISRGVTDYIRKNRDDEADLLTSRIVNSVHSYRTERALTRERATKTALLDALTGPTAETELARQFCARLVDEHGYACAWVGRDRQSGPAPLGVAGRGSYLDAILTPGNRLPADEPARQALDGGEPVRTRVEPGNADDEPAETWAAVATDVGFEGGIAVPVQHDQIRFGVLAAYAADRSLLTDREQATLVEYADTLGYALTSAARKHSLMATSPVTLRIELDVTAVPLAALHGTLPDGASLELLSTVPREDGTTLYVAEIHHSAAADLDAVEAVDGVRSLDESAGTARVELVVSEPTPEDLLASHGVHIVETAVTGDTVTLSLQVSDDTPVETIQDVLERKFDGANLSAIWTGPERPATTSSREALAKMTARQRDVLKHAYEIGYFERPRETSATELADHFDIARATFTQHLRTAQRKLLGVVFADRRTE